ncbi:hypothetical protein KM043_016254 [Ampulex compressa]|nr:hypothetical protein KM043_016254 [Ampulex compressa]
MARQGAGRGGGRGLLYNAARLKESNDRTNVTAEWEIRLSGQRSGREVPCKGGDKRRIVESRLDALNQRNAWKKGDSGESCEGDERCEATGREGEERAAQTKRSAPGGQLVGESPAGVSSFEISDREIVRAWRGKVVTPLFLIPQKVAAMNVNRASPAEAFPLGGSRLALMSPLRVEVKQEGRGEENKRSAGRRNKGRGDSELEGERRKGWGGEEAK